MSFHSCATPMHYSRPETWSGAADEMFEAVRDEEMEQLLLSPERLRDAGRSPSVRRAFEELRTASVGSKTPTQSGALSTAVPDCPIAAITLQPASNQAGL